ncbi:hypothetical protein SAMN05421788_106211 [Filimonas lacunae]|uniref:Uncharacterized protein n=1 Tax=Filimonas lacunae TaxID=477680 RepID=A0A1N7QPX6_9BACT|nr:hypothetical protein [Filimonas lacunae]SIT24923.1 hypothetical protein SAMN05421788_106211 [Filimonas lacunae]
MAEDVNKVKYRYLLVHDSSFNGEPIGRFNAVVCKANRNGTKNDQFPDYIRIEANGKQAVFRVKKADQGKNKIFIHPKTLPREYQRSEIAFYFTQLLKVKYPRFHIQISAR